MLGVPEADRPQFRVLVRDLVGDLRDAADRRADGGGRRRAAGDPRVLPAHSDRARSAATPGDGPAEHAGHWRTSSGDRLSDDELVTPASLLFAAGFETTTNLFGNGLLALLRHPDQLAAAAPRPSLFANLPDELLRYDGTAQLANRVTEASVDVGA